MSNRRFNTIVTETEERERDAAEQSATTLALATERAALAATDHESAEDHLAAVEGSFLRAVEDYTALDHATAVSDVRRRELEVTGTKRAVDKAKRDLRSTDTAAAEIVAEFLRPAFVGAEVIPTFALPGEPPRPSDLPTLVVHQSTDATRNADGTVQGEVELVYYRGPLNSELTVGMVEDAASATGVRIRHGLRVRTGSTTDRLKVEVRAAERAAAPAVLEVVTRDVQRLTGYLLGKIVSSTRMWDERIVRRDDKGLLPTGAVIGMPLAYDIAEQVISDGQRRLTVEASVGLWEKSTVSHPPLRDRISAVLEEETVGTFIPGLGVVETIERLPNAEGAAGEAAAEIRSASGTMHDSASVGYEGAFVTVVKVRAVLTSSTGVATLEDDAA